MHVKKFSKLRQCLHNLDQIMDIKIDHNLSRGKHNHHFALENFTEKYHWPKECCIKVHQVLYTWQIVIQSFELTNKLRRFVYSVTQNWRKNGEIISQTPSSCKSWFFSAYENRLNWWRRQHQKSKLIKMDPKLNIKMTATLKGWLLTLRKNLVGFWSDDSKVASCVIETFLDKWRSVCP